MQSTCFSGRHLDRLHNLLLDAWHRNIHDLFHGALLDALLRHKLNQLHEFHQDLWHWPIHDLLHDSIRHTLLRSYVDDFNCLRHWNIHDFLNGALLDALLRDQTRNFNDLSHVWKDGHTNHKIHYPLRKAVVANELAFQWHQLGNFDDILQDLWRRLINHLLHGKQRNALQLTHDFLKASLGSVAPSNA